MGNNIALNKSVTASSYVKPYAPSKAVDGSIMPLSRWLCNTLPGSINVDLGGYYWVNRWVVRHMPVAGWRSPDYVNCDFRLQGSGDNRSWADIDVVAGNTAAITDRLLPVALKIRYLRVYVTTGLKINPRLASIMALEIYEAPPTSPYLSKLALSSGTLAPAFSATTFNYTATVENSVSGITLTPTAEDTNATIQVNDQTVQSGVPSPAIPLTVGNNTIRVVVTSKVGGLISNYTITVNRQDSNFLKDLMVQTGTLDPAFAKTTSAYNVAVGFETKSITITPTAESPAATITVNGIAVTSGQPSGPVQLNVGSTTITVAVTASNFTRSYTITFTRADSAYLSALTAQSGTAVIPLSPSPFAKTTMDYNALVDYGTDTITVTPTSENSNASITINGTMVSSGSPSGPISLSVGDNFIKIMVAAGGGLSQGYSIKITRADSAYLSALAANSGSAPIALSPSTFVKEVLEYTAMVGYETDSATVTPTAESASALITVNGNPVISGQASASIPVGVGTNIIPVVVTAGGVITNYKITITRVDTRLSDLVLKGSPGNQGMKLIPDFQSTIFAYTASTGKGKVIVTPTTPATGSIIKVNGSIVASGGNSTPITLVGSTTIPVTVTIDSTTTTYTITVN